MAEDAKAQGYTFPYLFDETQARLMVFERACPDRLPAAVPALLVRLRTAGSALTTWPAGRRQGI